VLLSVCYVVSLFGCLLFVCLLVFNGLYVCVGLGGCCVAFCLLFICVVFLIVLDFGMRFTFVLLLYLLMWFCVFDSCVVSVVFEFCFRGVWLLFY